MRISTILTLFCILSVILAFSIESNGYSEANGVDMGQNVYRPLIIQQNMRFIQKHNENENSTFKMKAYSQFIALTPAQVRALYFMKPIHPESIASSSSSGIRIQAPTASMKLKATYVDLSISYGTQVLNQGACGNCYAFAATDAVNIFNKVTRKNNPPVSPQHLTDCSKGFKNNNGCNGGWLYESLDYQRAYGVYPLSSYSLAYDTVKYGKEQPCKTIPGATKYYISAWAYFAPPSACSYHLYYLSQGYPITIAVAGGNPFFWNYLSGVLPDCGSYTAVDHAVLLVGAYHDPNNAKGNFIKIKNSWGPGWGENGYIRISLGANVCQACKYGAFPYK